MAHGKAKDTIKDLEHQLKRQKQAFDEKQTEYLLSFNNLKQSITREQKDGAELREEVRSL